MTKWKQTVLCWCLVVCCLLALPLRVHAAEGWTPLTVPVEHGGVEPFLGNFLRSGSQVLVDLNTVAAFSEEIHIGRTLDGRSVALYTEYGSVVYPFSQIRQTQYGIYIPVHKTLVALGFKGEGRKEVLEILPLEETDTSNADQAEAWLKKAESSFDASLYWPEPAVRTSIPFLPVQVAVTWDPEYGNGDVDIDITMEGFFPDGAQVVPAQTEGVLLHGATGSQIATLEKTAGRANLEITQILGSYTISVFWGEMDILSGLTYGDIGLQIQVSTPVETLLTLAADPESVPKDVELTPTEAFCSHAPTGIWFYGFHLNHGRLTDLAREPIAYPEPAEEKTYTVEGQVESVRKFDDKGRLIRSEWYENGVCTSYDCWVYDEQDQLVQIRYQNQLEPEEIVLNFVYTQEEDQIVKVQLFNAQKMLLGEGSDACEAASQVGLGDMVRFSLEPVE